MNAERTISTPLAPTLRSWPANRFPYLIACDPVVFNAIRLETRESGEMKKTCGLLWGIHDGSKVEVNACSPLSLPRSVRGTPIAALPLVSSLRRALFDASARPEGLVPLGFYRAEITGQTPLSLDEARAFTELFPKPWQFVMVLHSGSDLTPEVGVFFRLSDGSISQDPSVHNLTPSRAGNAVGSLPPASSQEAEDCSTPSLLRFRTLASPATGSSRDTKRQEFWLLLAAAAITAIGLAVQYFYYPPAASSAVEPSAALNQNRPEEIGPSLRAEIRKAKSGPMTKLEWSPSIKTARNLPKGVLSISDAGVRREFLLNRQELDLGYTYYWPLSNEVTFRLMLEDKGRPVEESLLVIFGAGEAGNAKSASANRDSLTTLRAARVREQPPRISENIRARSPTHSTESARPLVMVPTDKSGGSSDGTAKPANKNAIEQTGNIDQPVYTPGVVPGIQQLAPSQLATIQSVAPAPQSRLLPNAFPTKLDFVPPAVVRRVTPVLPDSLRRFASENLHIRLQLEIDASGRVIECRSLSPRSGIYKYLDQVAREAIKQWQFSPGRLGGQPVASEKVLDLEFSHE